MMRLAAPNDAAKCSLFMRSTTKKLCALSKFGDSAFFDAVREKRGCEVKTTEAVNTVARCVAPAEMLLQKFEACIWFQSRIDRDLAKRILFLNATLAH